MMVCDSGTRSNKVTSDSFYWGTCHWKMPFLAPEMQQVLAGILAAILWTYFQGGRMCFKKMKSDEIELLRSDCMVLTGIVASLHWRVPTCVQQLLFDPGHSFILTNAHHSFCKCHVEYITFLLSHSQQIT